MHDGFDHKMKSIDDVVHMVHQRFGYGWLMRASVCYAGMSDDFVVRVYPSHVCYAQNGAHVRAEVCGVQECQRAHLECGTDVVYRRLT